MPVPLLSLRRCVPWVQPGLCCEGDEEPWCSREPAAGRPPGGRPGPRGSPLEGAGLQERMHPGELQKSLCQFFVIIKQTRRNFWCNVYKWRLSVAGFVRPASRRNKTFWFKWVLIEISICCLTLCKAMHHRWRCAGNYLHMWWRNPVEIALNDVILAEKPRFRTVFVSPPSTLKFIYRHLLMLN